MQQQFANRQFLVPELIPRTTWFNNLRSFVPQSTWDIIRKQCYRDANYRCEICGGKGEKWPVEAHEKWRFDDEKRIQYLDGLIALCPMCHKVKHIGFAGSIGMYPAARAWMARINGWTEELCEIAVKGEFKRWEERNYTKWILDYSNAPIFMQTIVREIEEKRTGFPAPATPSERVSAIKAQQREMELKRNSRIYRENAMQAFSQNKFQGRRSNQIIIDEIEYSEIKPQLKVIRKLRLEE